MKHTALKHDLKTISAAFAIYGDCLAAEPYGSGHINDTYRAAFNQGGTQVHYLFQRINHNIFKNPPALMENIERVTTHIFSKIKGQADATRRTLAIIPTRRGEAFHQDADRNFWRAYIFIEQARTYDVIENENQAYQAARAFGQFQQELVDLPGVRLHETIPDFHNTPKRFDALEKAIAGDVAGRVSQAGPEIEFALKRKSDASLLLNLNAQGAVPERITHNDTKLNNVMLDDRSGEGVCVIDLDTVMPGLVHYDFGDMVRTSTSPAAEDEKDLSRVSMQFNMFEALLRGYLASARDFLNPVEMEYLPFAGKLITMEIGVRFLTDFLSGDAYFKVHRAGHNLDRCRTQFALAASIEQQMDAMMRLLKNIIKEKD